MLELVNSLGLSPGVCWCDTPYKKLRKAFKAGRGYFRLHNRQVTFEDGLTVARMCLEAATVGCPPDFSIECDANGRLHKVVDLHNNEVLYFSKEES